MQEEGCGLIDMINTQHLNDAPVDETGWVSFFFFFLFLSSSLSQSRTSDGSWQLRACCPVACLFVCFDRGCVHSLAAALRQCRSLAAAVRPDRRPFGLRHCRSLLSASSEHSRWWLHCAASPAVEECECSCDRHCSATLTGRSPADAWSRQPARRIGSIALRCAC